MLFVNDTLEWIYPSNITWLSSIAGNLFFTNKFVLSNCKGKRRKFMKQYVLFACQTNTQSDCFEKGSTNIVEITEAMRKYMKSYLMWNFQNVNFMFCLLKINFFIHVFFSFSGYRFVLQSRARVALRAWKKEKKDTCWTWF